MPSNIDKKTIASKTSRQLIEEQKELHRVASGYLLTGRRDPMMFYIVDMLYINSLLIGKMQGVIP